MTHPATPVEAVDVFKDFPMGPNRPFAARVLEALTSAIPDWKDHHS